MKRRKDGYPAKGLSTELLLLLYWGSAHRGLPHLVLLMNGSGKSSLNQPLHREYIDCIYTFIPAKWVTVEDTLKATYRAFYSFGVLLDLTLPRFQLVPLTLG